MQSLLTLIITKEHQSHLIHTVTGGVIGRAVLGSSLAINCGVAKLDDYIVAFTTSLQVYTKLGVDASHIMSSHLSSSVMSSNTLLLSLVSLKVTELIACPMIDTIYSVRVNVCSCSFD